MSSRSHERTQPAAVTLPDRYRARRHLASGGMASVWCAEDLLLGRTVAVKVLSERFTHDEMAVRRFKREARAAAQVSTHPHVVTIFDVGDVPTDNGSPDGRAFIVMEYLAGGTLGDAIRVGAVRRQEAIRWVREAASALDHAHARGIVHRDIKPGNFLLDRSRVLHVADFGIARMVSEDTITSAGELFGTAAYLSPEQALGREATGASDRYALAVTTFELLTGERPFLAQHFTTQARQHIEAAPPFASERDRTLPSAVDEVLIRGMAKDPVQRFATAGAFVNALQTALSEIPSTAAAAGHGRRRDRSARRPMTVGSFSPARRAGGAVATWTPADSVQRGSG
ncbi:MAG: serine/threonine-protein kinase, partial [Solirubrobacteraceae bacterium]